MDLNDLYWSFAGLFQTATGMFQRQLQQSVLREQVSSRMAMAMPGAYGGARQGNAIERQLRAQSGYASSTDLYTAAQQLSQLGVLRGGPGQRGLTPDQLGMVRQAGLVGRMAGNLGMAGGAQVMANILSPQVTNALIAGSFGGVSINARPGGIAAQPLDVIGQMYQTATRGMRPEQAEQAFATQMAPGGRFHQAFTQAGFGPEAMQFAQQYGVARAEMEARGVPKEDIQEELSKRFKDTGESVRRMQAAISRITDTLSNAFVPVIEGLADILSGVLDPLGRAFSAFPALAQGLANTVAALAAFRLALMAQQKMSMWFGGRGGGPAAGGMPMGGGMPMMPGVGIPFGRGGVPGGAPVPGGGQLLGPNGMPIVMPGGPGAPVGGMARWAQMGGARGALGRLGVGTLSRLSAPSFKSFGVSMLGGMASSYVSGLGGEGEGGKRWLARDIGTVGQWTAAGAMFGPWGAAAGGVLGLGHVGLRHLTKWIGDPSDDASLLASPPSPAVTPPGGMLPGPGNDAHMDPELAGRLQSMFADNPSLSLTSGWRSPEEQAYLRWQHITGQKAAPVAPVGGSQHEAGRAADVGPASEFGWLAANAGAYGLRAPDSGEPWHFEVGDPEKKPARTKATFTARRPPRLAQRPFSNEEVDTLGALFRSGSILDTSPAGDPAGEAVVVRGGGGGSVHIGNVNIKVEIARGTPEEAEHTARYLMEIFGDRERIQALARTGGG